MIPKDIDKDWSAEVSAYLAVETTINICPPTGDALRLSPEILSFLEQNGVVSVSTHFILPPGIIDLKLDNPSIGCPGTSKTTCCPSTGCR